MLSIAMMMGAGITVAAAPSDQAPDKSAGNKGPCAVAAVTPVTTVMSAAMTSASIVAPMTAAVVASPVAYVMQVAVWCQVARAHRSCRRCWSGQAGHRPDNQTGTECQSCEYHFLLPIHLPTWGPACN